MDLIKCIYQVQTPMKNKKEGRKTGGKKQKSYPTIIKIFMYL